MIAQQDEVDKVVTEFIELAVDLANSVRADLKDHHHMITNHTIVATDRVQRKYKELLEILDPDSVLQ